MGDCQGSNSKSKWVERERQSFMFIGNSFVKSWFKALPLIFVYAHCFLAIKNCEKTILKNI